MACARWQLAQRIAERDGICALDGSRLDVCIQISTTSSPIWTGARLLSRIRDSVSPDLEIAAVTDRVCKLPGGGPGLLFERPSGFDMPVATNLFGSTERMCLALGAPSLDAVAKEIDEMMTPKMPAGMLDAFKMLPMLDRLRDLMPKTVKDAPCQEVVKRDGIARRAADSQDVARGWRPLHHPAARHYQGS